MREMGMTLLAALAALAAAGCSDDESETSTLFDLAGVGAAPAAPDQMVARATATADFNGDGQTDLAVLSLPASGGAGSIDVYYGPLGHPLPAASESYPAEASANDVAADDLDGDGAADLALAVGSGPYPGRIHLIFRRATGGVKAENELLTGVDPTEVRTADVDGDGARDVVATGNGAVFVVRGEGFGNFSLPYALWDVTDPAIADFNGDGRDDLAVRDMTNPSIVWVYGWNAGDFSATGVIGFSSDVTAIEAADLTGDGRADLAAGLTEGVVALAAGNGDFTFGTPAAVGSGAPGLMAVGRVNDDPYPDLVYATDGPSQLSTLTGTGTPYFGAAPNQPLPAPATDLDTADLDGDGVADVVICAGSVTIRFSKP
jgi:hypothetical protein